jgi:hypothetical protein
VLSLMCVAWSRYVIPRETSEHPDGKVEEWRDAVVDGERNPDVQVSNQGRVKVRHHHAFSVVWPCLKTMFY